MTEEEKRERRIEYARDYYLKNKEKIRLCQKAYRARPEAKENTRNRVRKYNEKPESKEKRKLYKERLSELIKCKYAEYRKRPEAKEKAKERRKRYLSKPEKKDLVRQRRIKYMKEYRARPHIIERRKKEREEYFSKKETKERRSKYAKLFGGSHIRRSKKRGNYTEKVKRIEIFKRDKFKCFYCKRNLKLDDCILEHKIPIAKGGSNTPENCTTSCFACNASKSAKLLPGLQISIFDNVKE